MKGQGQTNEKRTVTTESDNTDISMTKLSVTVLSGFFVHPNVGRAVAD